MRRYGIYYYHTTAKHKKASLIVICEFPQKSSSISFPHYTFIVTFLFGLPSICVVEFQAEKSIAYKI